jgi:tetratricopeptide (TPR) repeat protein
MTRFSILLCLLLGGFILIGADGCSSDPNVEGAKLDLKNKDYERAMSNLETALEADPDNVDALELKGQVIAEMILTMRDVDEHTELLIEMLDAYDRALILDPTLEESITQALRIAYSNEFTMGAQAFNRGRNDEAEFSNSAAFFKNAGRIMPDSSGAYVNQAYSLMNAGESAAAAQPLEKAIEKGDNERDTYVLLAGIYQAADRFDEAVTTLETAAQMYPNDADLQKELLNAYQLAGQADRALEVYAQAVETDPENKLFRYNYGSLLVVAERYEDAIAQLKAAIAIDPAYANAQYNLGAAYINMAVNVNDELTAMDDDYRANRDSMTQAQKDAKNQEMNDLADQRRGFFAMSIDPLENARNLLTELGEDATGVCAALFQAYGQTNDVEAAESVSACAGYDDTSGS